MSSTKSFTYQNWDFRSIHLPISDASDIEQTLKWLDQQARPSSPQSNPSPALHILPEMYFGNNKVVLTHFPSNTTCQFIPNESLTHIEVGPSGSQWQSVKVKAAKIWQQSKETKQVQPLNPLLHVSTCDEIDHTNSDTQTEQIQVFKPYDWTYSTSYIGQILNASIKSTTQIIPMDKLKIREQILFFDDNVLYEDELGDNGVSKYSIKLRVMPSGFLLLARHFLRVDHVQYAIRDNRIYHEFGTKHLLRERSVRVLDYQEIYKRAMDHAEKQSCTVFFDTSKPCIKPRVQNVGGMVSSEKELDPQVLSLLVNEGWVCQNMMELVVPAELHTEWIDMDSQ